MPPQRRSRIYWRNGRAWGDFRDFTELGGKLEPLVPAGERFATRDPDVAADLAAAKIREYQQRRRTRHLQGGERQATLREYAAHHLVEKARAGKVTDFWLERTQERLESAIEYLGDRELAEIRTRDVQGWAAHLASKPGKYAGSTLSPGTIRHYLNALSNLFQRAQSEGYVLPGYNPVAAMLEKPTARREEAHWLEVHEAARLQTLDRGAPVSPWTVAKEMGHGGRELTDRVYGHLGQVRHRVEVVEYQIAQHRGGDSSRALANAHPRDGLGSRWERR